VVNRVAYRVWQFIQATFSQVRQDEYILVERHLLPAQMALFMRMDRLDQRHCLDVFYTLYNAHHRDDALLKAALLHDVGKADVRLRIWHRVSVVLMRRFVPGWLDRLAADGRGWKAPFSVHVRHAETSAQWAADAGCTIQVIDLIRRHHEKNPKNERLAALRWADEQN
jgi:putative nucleotidyltransferase with HDIG domain